MMSWGNCSWGNEISSVVFHCFFIGHNKHGDGKQHGENPFPKHIHGETLSPVDAVAKIHQPKLEMWEEVEFEQQSHRIHVGNCFFFFPSKNSYGITYCSTLVFENISVSSLNNFQFLMCTIHFYFVKKILLNRYRLYNSQPNNILLEK